MARINIKGDIVIDRYKKFYDWLGWDCTCPKDVTDIIEAAQNDEPLDVFINSPGGIVEAGQEIYTALLGDPRVNIYITGQACSAASFIAMAGHCEMSPVGLMMVHCASMHAGGNHNDLERAVRELKTTDKAIAQAYALKSGMTLEKAIGMMEEETWLTSKQCVELGLADGIMHDETQITQAAAASQGLKLTPEIMAKVQADMKAEAEKKAEADNRRQTILADIDRFGSN